MTPEMQSQLDEASLPFIESGGAISHHHTRMKSWRYFLEINSACNLHCPTCTKGNMDGYDHQTGIMDWDLMLRCIEKIKNENNDAIVFLYGNSEPFLHPRLADCIRAVKAQGLNCQISTNLNFVRDLEEVLSSGLDFMIISLSGFTQEVYVKGHSGGKIDKVKENMQRLSEARSRVGDKFPISVNYHVYQDNQHEVAAMREYAASLGIGFFTSYARAISMENAIQYNRSLDPEATLFEVQPGRPDWNQALPPVSQTYIDSMKRLIIPPSESQAMYGKYPAPQLCPIGWMFTFIRHDGKTELCACVADRRITLGNFLETSQDDLIQQRTGHAICLQCSKYRLRYYFHISDRERWTPNV